jgi:STE24 endopeptidase
MTLSGSAIILIILATLVLDFTMTGVADLLNLRNMKPDIPTEFQGIYEKEKYVTSQQYLKACTRFGFITSFFNLAVVLIFWFGKGFVFLDILVRSWTLGPVATGLCYIGILLLLKAIVSLPFSVYSTFVIEERFGFNKTTPALFMIDLIKSTLVAVALGSLLLGGILLFLEHSGPRAWLLCWGISALFTLAVQYIVPTWIMPIFNRFTPLEAGELRDAITQYADSIDFSLENIFVMDGSKRSSKSNAFFTGFGKNRRIVLFDTLIAEHTPRELVAVLAHEMGHFKRRHITRRLVMGIAQMGIIFFLISVCISHQGLFDAFFMDKKSVYAGLVFFGMLFSPVDIVLSMVLQAMSRRDEYEADRFAADTTPDKEDMVNALKKLSVHNLSNLFPHPFHVFLNYSHPPVLERIRAIRRLGTI